MSDAADPWFQKGGQPPTVLIVEDETGVRSTLEVLFEDAGFKVLSSPTGYRGVQMASQHRPTLVVLDWNLPDLSGLEVARCIKEHPLTYHSAIILVTARTSLPDRLSGLEYADDFICKPFDTHELLARARAVLRRLARSLGCNPLTGLPGNLAVEEALKRLLAQGHEMVVVQADLDNFKPYNDHYGYDRGDDVLAFTAQLLWETLGTLGEDWFLGHIGGDDFFFALPAGQWPKLGERMVQRFDEGIRNFYDEADVKRGGVMGHDRQGNPALFGLLSLTLAGVRTKPGQFQKPADVGQALAAVKAKGKSLPGSQVVTE